ncbi:MAG: NADH-quinone oxidoreductase subunit J [Alphaproteobacteria bacterium]|nr:NADH-quinone oxidoreductase subunit J [Alphaproteobacteria bacterium]
MVVQALAFYIFAAVATASGVMVISSRNPVHSVLFLILSFFNVAGLFILMGAEFLAMLLVVVYVGAVAVLFLFVVMMLDINFVELREGFLQYLPIGSLVGIVLFIELLLVGGSWVLSDSITKISWPMLDKEMTNTHALGYILYTDYIYLFQTAGLILLVAMIGAIVLTHRRRSGVYRQRVSIQVNRRREDTIEIVKFSKKVDE